MNFFILAFIVVGIVFGLATAGHQQRFNEGRCEGAQQGHRGLWVLLCSLLWPLMLLAGLHNGVKLLLARRAAAGQRR
jgi:spore maturation protein SpmA